MKHAKRKPPAAGLAPSDAMRMVREVYAAWEQSPPERHCTGRADCCRFRLTGRTPYLTMGEAMVAVHAWRAAGQRELPQSADGSCPFLHRVTGKCRIYQGRPFGCRTHFCEAAGGAVARREVRHFIQRLEEIDHLLGGSGAVNLPAAVKQALAGPV